MKLFGLTLILSPFVFADDLSLNSYLEEVKISHTGYLGAMKNAEGAIQKKGEFGLFFSPYFYVDANYSDNKDPLANIAVGGDETKRANFSLGFTKETRYGLKSKLFYSFENVTVLGANTLILPLNNYFGTSINVEVTQPFWKNGFGAKNVALEESVIFQNESKENAEFYRTLQILTDSEIAYWSVSFFRKILSVQKSSLDRANQILQFTKNQFRKNLLDESDVLQAQAGLEFRRLEMQMAVNNLRTAKQEFNSFRGKELDEVSEELILPDLKYITGLKVPDRLDMRLDVVAALKSRDAFTSSAKVKQEDTKPDFELYLRGSLAGLDQTYSGASNSIFSTENPTGAIGIRLNIPLDRETVNNTFNGYFKEQLALELDYQRKLLDQNVSWGVLLTRFDEAKKRLNIAVIQEKFQKLKLENEKKIAKRGRSTTYQVLLFEQDYLNSQVSKLRTAFETLSIHAQLKTFGDLR